MCLECENLAMYSSSCKNSVTQVLHYSTFHFLGSAHFRSAKRLFTNTRKQENPLKSSLLFKKNIKFTGKKLKKCKDKESEVSRILFYKNTNT